MHRAMQACGEGIRWKDNQRLMDLDFADDISLLGESREDLQNLINRVEKGAGSIWSIINSAKMQCSAMQ